MNSEELIILDILFILYKNRFYNNIIIPNIVIISKLVLLIKYSSKSQILNLGIILYIYYNINLFNYIAPTLFKIIQGNALILPIYRIRAIII